MTEADFGFNTTSFISAINKAASALDNALGKIGAIGEKVASRVNKAFGLTGRKVETTATEMSKGITSGPMLASIISAGEFLGNMFLEGFHRATAAINKYIPEIGQTFSFVGEIFLKNFLWPLRQLLIPILQSVLRWTQDNRANFVRLGNVLANAFRVMWQVGKTVFGMLEKLISGFMGRASSSFTSIAGDIERVFNILLHKVNVVMTFLQMYITPIFEIIGRVIRANFELMETFGNAVFKNLKPIIDFFSKEFGPIIKMMGDFATKSNMVQVAFEGIKMATTLMVDSIGLLVRTAIVPMVVALELAVLAMKKLKGEQVSLDTGKLAKDIKDLVNFGMIAEDAKAGAANVRKAATPVKDAIITKTGQVIKVDPNDNIMAFQNAGRGAASGMGGGVNAPISFNVQVNVTEGDAESAGKKFASAATKDIGQQLRYILQTQMVERGAYRAI